MVAILILVNTNTLDPLNDLERCRGDLFHTHSFSRPLFFLRNKMSSPPLNTKNMENMCAQLAARATRMQMAYEASVQPVPVGKVDCVANENKRAMEENTGDAASNRAYEESTGGAVSKRCKTQSVDADDIDRICIDD